MLLLAINRIIIVSMAVLYSLACAGQARPARDINYTYKAPQQLNDGIVTANIADAGIDSDKIIKLTKLILADTFTNIHSLLHPS